MKKALITGARGFVGKYTALKFSENNYYVVGVGNGSWEISDFSNWGIKEWHENVISIQTLLDINIKFDIIVHCGGSASVNFSWENPYDDFQKTVQSTISLLEYIRLYNSECKLIYPSSPAVQGEVKEFLISEEDEGCPVSPYGFNKKIAEEICRSYHSNYGLEIGIIRLYSIYGPGLKKQLLWDACLKITKDEIPEFFGSGDEARDFLHISDAVNLIYLFSLNLKGFDIINGGSGQSETVRNIVLRLASFFNKESKVCFNQKSHTGNPSKYCANIKKALDLGWKQEILLDNGLSEYVKFYKSEVN